MERRHKAQLSSSNALLRRNNACICLTSWAIPDTCSDGVGCACKSPYPSPITPTIPFPESSLLTVHDYSGHAFSANSVLLFDIAQRLLYKQPDHVRVQAQLAKSQACIDMLAGCAESDRVAKTMTKIVLPLHNDLLRLASTEAAGGASGPRASGIYDLLGDPQSSAPTAEVDVGDNSASIRAEVIPAMQNAIQVLGNPFGHPRRLNVDSFAAGDPSVPSWWN